MKRKFKKDDIVTVKKRLTIDDIKRLYPDDDYRCVWRNYNKIRGKRFRLNYARDNGSWGNDAYGHNTTSDYTLFPEMIYNKTEIIREIIK